MPVAVQRPRPLALVREIVETHRATSPQLTLVMAIWMNANEDPWSNGVELLEIYQIMPINDPPDFRPIEWAPQEEWPRLRLIPTSVREIKVELYAKGMVSSFFNRVRRVLRRGPARIIFPKSRRSGEEMFKELLISAE